MALRFSMEVNSFEDSQLRSRDAKHRVGPDELQKCTGGK